MLRRGPFTASSLTWSLLTDEPRTGGSIWLDGLRRPQAEALLPSWWLNGGTALQNDAQQFGRSSISRTGSRMCFNCLPQ
jgi:hypothetical protein